MSLVTHAIASVVGAPADRLDDVVLIRRAVVDACARHDATVLSVIDHRFEPQGVTVLALLAESHVSVHTWPELGGAYVDALTCGTADARAIVRSIVRVLGGAANVEVVSR